MGESALFLKSLDITGFKSFARTTRFEFTPGITALVGPNGSGKSNVVDAIRWCLGEQSVRDLRGQRAEDVIYAGARHVLGAAEVSLTFSPTGDEAASQGDITIARRLYRSGESEYLVDGRKARLRDLLDTLRGLGIDGSRHIVVTQGMADALLSAAPAERRSLLEQAAGLSGYRVRRDEARQKLGTTEQNIATIALVLEELEPRLRALHRQARAVQERAEAQALLHRRLHDWYASRWRVAGDERDARMTQAERVAEDRRLSETRLAELEQAMEAVFQREREWQQRVDMLVAANHALERDRDAAERARSEIVQKLESAGRQREGAQVRGNRAREAEQEAEQRIAGVVESLRISQEDKVRLQAEEEELGQRLERERAELQAADAEWQRIRREATAREQAARVGMQRGEELLREIQRVGRRRQEVEQGLASAQAALQEGEREIAALASTVSEAAARKDTLTARLEAAEDVAAAWRTRATRLEVMAVRTRGAATDAQRRRDVAQKTLQSLETSGSESLLHGISVERGWETAIAVALGAWAHASLEGDTAAFMHEDRNAGFDAWRRTLDPAIWPGRWADGVVEGMPSGRVNPLRTAVLVETETEAQQAWNRLQDLPGHTVRTPAVRVVTRAGVCWNAVGRETLRGDDRAASYLRLKGEIVTVTARCAVLSQRAARLDVARADARTQRAQIEGEIAGLQASLRAGRSRLSELETRLAFLQRQRVDLDMRTEAFTREQVELVHAEALLLSERAQWEVSQQELDRATHDCKRQVETQSRQVEARRARVSALDTQRFEARHAHEVAAANHQAQTHLLAAIQSERVRQQSELDAGRAEKAELEETMHQLEAELSIQAQQVERLNRLLEEHSTTLSAARAIRPTRAVSGEQLREARAAVSTLVRLHERAQAEALGAQERMNALANEIAEELQVQPDTLHPSDQEPPSEAEVKRLRSRAMQYADADSSVVEEARELAERHSYLVKHVEDLRSAADTLRVMMEVADTEMRTRFDRAFVAVSEEFSRVFEVMLRGGRARLQQLEGGGVEVIAQLPGKRSRSSAAFSGGERSLIASSLLFGVLKMRPAPFCVLDEVDAALDESNVDRYLAALRDISRKTQAVVVTHNRATMAAADVLYGLTMDAEGSSGVLSLRLDAQAAG